MVEHFENVHMKCERTPRPPFHISKYTTGHTIIAQKNTETIIGMLNMKQVLAIWDDSIIIHKLFIVDNCK